MYYQFATFVRPTEIIGDATITPARSEKDSCDILTLAGVATIFFQDADDRTVRFLRQIATCADNLGHIIETRLAMRAAEAAAEAAKMVPEVPDDLPF